MCKWFQIKQKINGGNLTHTTVYIHSGLRESISYDCSKFRFHVTQNYYKSFFMLFKFSWLKVVCVWLITRIKFLQLKSTVKVYNSKERSHFVFFIFLQNKHKAHFLQTFYYVYQIFYHFRFKCVSHHI